MDPTALLSMGKSAQNQFLGFVKSLIGARMAKKGMEGVEQNLEAIKYTRPDEYNDMMSLLKGRSRALSGRADLMSERIKSDTASGVNTIKQLAGSSVEGLGAFTALKDSERKARSDLDVWVEGQRDRMTMDEVAGLQRGAEYSDKEAYYDDMYKKMVRMNMGANKYNAGMNMFSQGLESALAAQSDYAGTSYMGSVMNPTTPQGPVGGSVNPNWGGPVYNPATGQYEFS